MNTKEMQAKLLFMPVDIEEIFFADVSVKVSPSKEENYIELEIRDIAFNSSVAVLNEENREVQVNVRFFTPKSDTKTPIEFSILCVGVYKWTGENFTEEEVKNIYSWGVSVQTSMVRQRISQEMLNSPYHQRLYLPLALVKIDNKNKIVSEGRA